MEIAFVHPKTRRRLDAKRVVHRSAAGRPIARVLTVPGWTGSGPDHWQTLWERSHPELRRVEMPDWDRPVLDDWVAALDAAIGSGAPAVLVAHSLGCLAAVHRAERVGGSAAGIEAALLVAPPDADREDAPPEIAGFAPIPTGRLPFPAVVVASRTDPWIDFDRARELARAWDAEFVDIGDAGHVNTDAGFGPWPAGETLLAGLTAPRDNP